jgi:hypothetical protein
MERAKALASLGEAMVKASTRKAFNSAKLQYAIVMATSPTDWPGERHNLSVKHSAKRAKSKPFEMDNRFRLALTTMGPTATSFSASLSPVLDLGQEARHNGKEKPPVGHELQENHKPVALTARVKKYATLKRELTLYPGKAPKKAKPAKPCRLTTDPQAPQWKEKYAPSR